jgi:hypothetical protein
MEADPSKARCLRTNISGADGFRRPFFPIQLSGMRSLLFFIASMFSFVTMEAQVQGKGGGFPVQPQFAEGLPVKQVIIVMDKSGQKVLADSLETDAFYKAFQLKPGSIFRQAFADKAIQTINAQSFIKSSNYQLYNSSYSDPVIMVVNVVFLKQGEQKIVDGKKGLAVTGRDFPLIYQSDKAQISFILNGGVGLFNENNAQFTKGNPIATMPAGKGVRFWGEAYLEPGVSAISQLGSSNTYLYGAGSVLISGRNTTDIYTEGSTIYAAFERLYGGILFAKLGKNKQTNIDISAGRQFFQLNDGFLISKFSGSANAGERGSVYLNSRTTFQKTAMVKFHSKNWYGQGFFLEPQELFKERQSNTNYTGASLMFNNNKSIDVGLSYIQLTGGTSSYGTPFGSIAKKGMYIINPKLWLQDIGSTGIFFKSEYAFQSHHKEDMRSNAWYLGLGIKKNKWKYSPSLYYRYAFMKGDDSLSRKYERFDPMLTGGLGNWVQGINFRKVNGSGNIISHRVEAKANFSRSFEMSVDYFLLRANTLSNIGSLSPLAKLKDVSYGHEVTVTTRYFLSSHFMILGIFSYADPGDAISKAFSTPVYPWTSIQGALFMFF